MPSHDIDHLIARNQFLRERATKACAKALQSAAKARQMRNTNRLRAARRLNVQRKGFRWSIFAHPPAVQVLPGYGKSYALKMVMRLHGRLPRNGEQLTECKLLPQDLGKPPHAFVEVCAELVVNGRGNPEELAVSLGRGIAQFADAHTLHELSELDPLRFIVQ